MKKIKLEVKIRKEYADRIYRLEIITKAKWMLYGCEWSRYILFMIGGALHQCEALFIFVDSLNINLDIL